MRIAYCCEVFVFDGKGGIEMKPCNVCKPNELCPAMCEGKQWTYTPYTLEDLKRAIDKMDERLTKLEERK